MTNPYSEAIAAMSPGELSDLIDNSRPQPPRYSAPGRAQVTPGEPSDWDEPDAPLAPDAYGYEDLYGVLESAFEQATQGKGRERHAQDKPFAEQPMQKLIDLYGPGFAAGQVGKKCQEALRLPRTAAVQELLGAIVYAAGLVVWLERDEV